MKVITEPHCLSVDNHIRREARCAIMIIQVTSSQFRVSFILTDCGEAQKEGCEFDLYAAYKINKSCKESVAVAGAGGVGPARAFIGPASRTSPCVLGLARDEAAPLSRRGEITAKSGGYAPVRSYFKFVTKRAATRSARACSPTRAAFSVRWAEAVGGEITYKK
ncbi:hypothetical protein EVAR_32433_1 [Eumeta japonica]|uniref:Uncharacterized protein n=1 Tax=Eumeta variegata TaxID=151549 RepID=A0A4C1VLP7_EUMVA|nr:hypothetical protein EVAR_32433_1 [Eumeta japonica]